MGGARTLPVAHPGNTSAAAWDAPATADRGLLVIHGAGAHERHTTLYDLLNPTLARMRLERCLVRVSPVRAGDESEPGGAYDGLVIEYTKTPMDNPLPEPDKIQRLLVIEGRWDRHFIDSRIADVSVFVGSRASRMLWEVFCFHFRNLYAFIVAMATLALIVGGVVVSATDDSQTNRNGFILVATGLAMAFIAALLDAIAPWRDYEERVAYDDDKPPTIAWLWNVFPAFTMAIYHVQRGIVLSVMIVGMVVLPFAAFITRVFGTVPGLRALSRGLLTSLESALLTGAPTDVEAIANNYVAAGAIQNRVQGALMELESRLACNAPVTVLAHSAGAPIAWWLLSEPGIHARQTKTPYRYRLITVGGALNWMKRGLDCEATSLDWPLVNSEPEPGREKTIWLNAFSTWDPPPHGPVRRSEYNGAWATLTSQPKPQREGQHRDVPTIIKPLLAVRDSWASLCRPQAGSEEASDARENPNVLCRNLGSPISAEHSEYFRNQQEFIPLLLRAIDDDIGWAAHETQDKRRRVWGNVRLAMLSGLVRARILALSAPAAYLILAVTNERIFTICESRTRFRGSWLATVGDQIHLWISSVPVVGGGITRTICNHIWIEDVIMIVLLALVAFAVVEVYTNFCWASLGRRVDSLDPACARSPGRFAGATPLGVALLWVPTVMLPFAFYPFQLGSAWYALVAGNALLAMAEMFWFHRCLLGLDGRRYPETTLGYGRYGEPFFI
jgi:hypothetical protein